MKNKKALLISVSIVLSLLIILLVALFWPQGDTPITETPPVTEEAKEPSFRDLKIEDFTTEEADYWANVIDETNGVTTKQHNADASKYKFLDRNAFAFYVVTDNLGGNYRISNLIYAYSLSTGKTAFYDDFNSVIQESMKEIGYTDKCTKYYILSNLQDDHTENADLTNEMIDKLENGEGYTLEFVASEEGLPSLSINIMSSKDTCDAFVTVHYPYNPSK